jgi:hypothetical protein
VRPWHERWGATEEEASMALPGDDLIVDAAAQTTRAITVDADPAHVWPWLVQMGHGRGGLYSWDALDRLFGVLDRPSATRILPEYQDLAAGDVIPVKHGPDFPVLVVEPERTLVLGSGDPSFPVTWQTVLRPLPEGGTRLITRNRLGRVAGTSRLVAAAFELPTFVMVKRWLEVLKERGEGLRAGRYT